VTTLHFRSLARLMVIMALSLLIGLLVLPAQLTHAESRYNQLRMGFVLCTIYQIPFTDAEQKICNTDNIQPVQIQRVEGYNQNGDRVIWDAREHPCEADGNNATYVRGWWWDFDHPEGVKVTIGGQTFTLHGSFRTYWVNVLLVHNFWNNRDFGYDITYQGTDY